VASRQLPIGKEVFLDHVAHFVPDIEAAGRLLTSAGFRLTPLTAQQNHTPEGPVPAGMANRCVMLREGYIELLTAVSESELANRFRSALQRYTGLHLLALSTADPLAEHDRLEREGFSPDPPVHLRRAIELADGMASEARFTVLRLPPQQMPEGRIQMVTHHTEEAVWQSRWLDHHNGVVSLQAVLIVVGDPQEAAERFGRFAGRDCERQRPGQWHLPLDRGRVVFTDVATQARLVPWAGPPPSLPWIAGYGLGSVDQRLTRERFVAAGIEVTQSGPSEVSCRFPPLTGGFATVTAPEALPSWAV
jgi:hypothetical protein